MDTYTTRQSEANPHVYYVRFTPEFLSELLIAHPQAAQMTIDEVVDRCSRLSGVTHTIDPGQFAYLEHLLTRTLPSKGMSHILLVSWLANGIKAGPPTHATILLETLDVGFHAMQKYLEERG